MFVQSQGNSSISGRDNVLVGIGSALAVCRLVHDGQKDMSGSDFYMHPVAVASAVQNKGLDYLVVALLHDTLEDCPEKISEDFIRRSYNDQVADAVVAITRNEGEKYFDYIQRCGKNDIARVVKVADIRHNMLRERFPGPDKVYNGLMQRYEKALGILYTIEEGKLNGEYNQ